MVSRQGSVWMISSAETPNLARLGRLPIQSDDCDQSDRLCALESIRDCLGRDGTGPGLDGIGVLGFPGLAVMAEPSELIGRFIMNRPEVLMPPQSATAFVIRPGDAQASGDHLPRRLPGGTGGQASHVGR